MKRSRHSIPTSANNINAESALPGFMQTSAGDSDVSLTWREVVAVHGVSQESESGVFFPRVRIKAQNGFVARGGDDDLTIEEAMKKGIAPPGMRPTWSPEARKRYEACIAPDIEIYKKAVDKINKNAQDVYREHKKDYYGQSLGLGSIPLLFDAAGKDTPINYKLRQETLSQKLSRNKNRIMFWLNFGAATYFYIDKRFVASRKEADEFSEATETFFKRVTECREKHPYDMWVQLSPSDSQIKEFLDAIKHPPFRKII